MNTLELAERIFVEQLGMSEPHRYDEDMREEDLVPDEKGYYEITNGKVHWRNDPYEKRQFYSVSEDGQLNISARFAIRSAKIFEQIWRRHEGII